MTAAATSPMAMRRWMPPSAVEATRSAYSIWSRSREVSLSMEDQPRWSGGLLRWTRVRGW